MKKLILAYVNKRLMVNMEKNSIINGFAINAKQNWIRCICHSLNLAVQCIL